MTAATEGGRDDCCEETLPVFLDGGDDLAVHLRELAFAVPLTAKAPVEPATLARLAGSDEGQVAASLDALARAGRIDRDDQGRVLGAAGLTLGDGAHGLAIDGHSFRTWCAFDALGIPAALRSNAQVATGCAVCGRPIDLELQEGRVAGRPSARPTVLLCSPAHAEAWAERQHRRGRALTMTEAVDLGATNRASVAATAEELRRVSAGVNEDRGGAL